MGRMRHDGWRGGPSADNWSPEQESACRGLWAAVLLRQIEDATGPEGGDCRSAISWIGAFPSRNFKMVCDLAGVDPDAAHERALRLIAEADVRRAEERRQKARKLAEAINGPAS